MIFSIANAALHDLAIPVLRILSSAFAFSTFALPLAAAAKVSPAFAARAALDKAADTAGSFGGHPSPCSLVLPISPIGSLQLLYRRRRSNGGVQVKILLAAVVRGVGVRAVAGGAV